MLLTTADKYTQDPLDQINALALVPTRKKMSKIEEWSQTHYLFNPGRIIDISDWKYGKFNLIPRARFVPVKNWVNNQQSMRRYEENSNEVLAEYTTYAAWIAQQLATVYAKPQYVINVVPYIGILYPTIQEVQKIVMPNYAPTTPKLIDALEQALQLIEKNARAINEIGNNAGKADLVDLSQQAFTMMLSSTLDALSAQTERLETAKMERENAETTGKKFYDIDDRELAYLLEREGELDQRQPSFSDAIAALAASNSNSQGAAQAAPDVAREQCLGCGELVAVARKKCHYCGEKKAIAA